MGLLIVCFTGNNGELFLIYLFGNYSIDVQRVELRHGSKLLFVEPQVFDVILYLIRKNDRVVSSEELFDNVWGGRIVSLSTLTTRINAARKAVGDNGIDQAVIKTIHRKGYRFVASVVEVSNDILPVVAAEIIKPTYIRQDVQFCTSGNSVRIAYARAGAGPPIVKVGTWFNHLEYDWDSPVWGHMLHWLARENELVRYDMRGIGLSDNDVQEISFEAFVRDLESVVNAAGLTDFILLGVSDGAAFSIAYAVKHPDRVRKLVILGGYAEGPMMRSREVDEAQFEASMMMIKPGFGENNRFVKTMFSSMVMPNGTPQQTEWLHMLQSKSKSSENTLRKLVMSGDINIVDLLPQVKAPTIVFHCRDDRHQPFEQGRKLAAGIPRATFVALEGSNHFLQEQDSGWPIFQDEVTSFLAR
jgi:pimeloyl-ACP methyl ester carboxylesterase/DNA-binding winged helix-turn-helix (wHTH) protein